ncbi:MAG: tRNA uridine-5-carboxymethylaminomethyl(34) synthesis GTPase MnmE [Gammaproteobacteria bacterium]|nr:tRNA uridine-5-carboxymethylaminomethyl(34) synthesis GTPase MnmE [Gammaproteobacteria bacterium]MCZ6853046.1 tRNA uridine-5-carboxymethylaminomethyl(34) synthesis GTPase MnmE [Gammaproteobacteria bacterium]
MAAETIAAVATPPGQGGIGIVRLSGPDAKTIGEGIVGQPLQPRRVKFSEFKDRAGNVLDEGLVLYFAAPRSFTGEDVIELQGHGGPVVMQLLLDEAVGRGARLARPGEFTERAFLNGKIDLAQAEAVADLIGSSSRAAARGAVRSLKGDFSKAVFALDQQVLQVRVYMEAAMDFPDEEVDFLSHGQVVARLGEIRQGLDRLLRDSTQGVLLNEGITVAILGAPNVGKSSILNVLSGEERAIVTDIPGTTRDLLHVDLTLQGLPIRIVDTAGLRDTSDPVEIEGVRRAEQQAAEADLVLWVTEAGQEETTVWSGSDCMIHVANKVDLTEFEAGPARRPDGHSQVKISAKTGAGIDVLRTCILEKAGFAPGEGSTFTARKRHMLALGEALGALQRGQALIDENLQSELVTEELRIVHEALGTIVGVVTADDLLGEIFANFCIGK